MSAVLGITDVRRVFGAAAALDGVTLQVAAGEVLALLGPNGAGKSTLVRLAAGVDKPDSGTVRIHDTDPRRNLATRRRVGVAPQDIGVYPQLTVAQNLRAFGEASGALAPGRARARADALLEPFALGPLAGREAGKLSGGEQRRLHTAAALVHQPTLILLDEPTAGADPATRNAILEVVLALAADGAAVLYTTHYLPEVERLDPSVAILERGRVVASGSVDDLVGAHGEASLVLRFAGGPPDAARAHPGATVADDGALSIACPDPADELRELLLLLGEDGSALQHVSIVHPSLEAAYLALTGRRGTNVEAVVGG